MTVAEQITDERLAEIASAANHLTAHSPHPRITVAEAAKLVTELQHRREAEAGKSNYPEIPEGWVLVPREPTPAMLDAGVLDHAGELSYEDARACYDAMLAASPSSPASGVRVTNERIAQAILDVFSAAEYPKYAYVAQNAEVERSRAHRFLRSVQSRVAKAISALGEHP